MDATGLWGEGPHAWAGWLVWADRLVERGDPRGELLHLEHRLATGGPDPELRAFVDELATLEADALAETLPDTTGSMESDADALKFAVGALVRVRGLLSWAPAEARRTLERPVTQLLAIADGPGFPQAFAADLRSATLAWIQAAFDGVPPPGPESRTWRQAEAADNYAMCGRGGDFLGRWQDIPDEEFLDRQWAQPHLDAAGLHYYLPALMCFDLRHQPEGHPDDSWVTQSLGYSLTPSSPGLREHQRGRFSPLEPRQRAAIAGFCAVRYDDETWERWARCVDGPEDWYPAFLGR